MNLILTLRLNFSAEIFRGRVTRALEKLKDNPPDVFNHNLENVPRLYKGNSSVRIMNGQLKLLVNLGNVPKYSSQIWFNGGIRRN